MFALVMFAMIGAELNLGTWYWIAYGGYAVGVVMKVIAQALQD